MFKLTYLSLLFSSLCRYVKQCEVFLLDGRISCEMFASECLPTLIHLARDKVPNVRIAVAKMLKESVLGIGMVLNFSTSNIRIEMEEGKSSTCSYAS